MSVAARHKRPPLTLPSGLCRLGAFGRVLLLLSGSLGAALLSFATQLLCARALTVADYGHLVALLAAVNIAAVFSGYGIGWFWLQIFGREGQTAYRWIGSTVRLLGVALLAASALLTLYVIGISDFASPWAASALLLPILLGQGLAETTAARLQLEERFAALSLWQSLTQVGRFVISVVTILLWRADLLHLLAGFAAIGMFTMVISAVSLYQVYRRQINLIGHEQIEVAAPESGVRLSIALVAATPYCFCTIFYLIYSQGVVAIVERMSGAEPAAMYNTAFLVIAAIYLVPSVVYMKYLVAKIFRWSARDPEMFSAVINLGIVAGIICGFASMLVVMATASFVIPALFGSRYAAAVPVLTLLAVGIPIRFVQHAYGAAFFSEENMKLKVYYLGVAAAICLVLSGILVPLFGVLGAAFASIFSELVLLLFFMRGVARHVNAIDIRSPFSIKEISVSLACIERRNFGSEVMT